MKPYLLIILSFVFSLVCNAQEQLHDTIKEVVVIEKKITSYKDNTQYLVMENLPFLRNNSVQHILQYYSNIFVKNYGVGNLSTISIRGASAAQTQVLWQGININNASTGLSDFSNLPNSFFDQIEINYGSDIKNASMGGAVILNNHTNWYDKGIKVNASIGYESLKNINASLGIKTISTHHFNDFRLYVSRAQNEYSIDNPEKKITEKLTNAASKQVNLLNQYTFKFNARSSISWHLWAQYLDREIPPAIFEDKSAKHETNQSIRSLFVFEKDHLFGFKIKSTAGILHEKYNYQDSLIFLESNTSVISLPLDILISKSIRNKQQITCKIIGNQSFLLNRSDANLMKGGVNASYSIDQIFKRIGIKASLQKEFTNVFDLPLIGNFTINTRFANGLQLFGTVSSNYRIPTLNELYYQPGGNLNLKPETSKNIEGGCSYLRNIKRHHLSSEISLYHRQVKNWIAWYGSSILTPHNIQQVKSRGLEVITQYEFDWSKKVKPKAQNQENDTLDIQLIEVILTQKPTDAMPNIHRFVTGLLYAYTLSTTEESAIANDYSIGKQIPYVPRYQLKLNAGVKWNSFECHYIHTYTGYRFITTDESEYLEPYFTGNLFAMYSFKVKRYVLQANMRFNNIFDQRFESISGRIMPGRNLSIGMTWKME